MHAGTIACSTLRQHQRNEERRSQRDCKDDEINNAAKKEFENADEPALPVNATDREENLHHERDPEERDNPAGDRTWRCAVEAECCEHDQHDPDVSECVDVKRVNQMVDIKNAATKIENFQNKSEQRDTAQHHVRQVAEECGDEESELRSMLAEFFFCARFEPAFERR